MYSVLPEVVCEHSEGHIMFIELGLREGNTRNYIHRYNQNVNVNIHVYNSGTPVSSRYVLLQLLQLYLIRIVSKWLQVAILNVKL